MPKQHYKLVGLGGTDRAICNKCGWRSDAKIARPLDTALLDLIAHTQETHSHSTRFNIDGYVLRLANSEELTQ